MTNAEKNRFIVEKVLGECWHEATFQMTNCIKCGVNLTFLKPLNLNFYSADPDEQAVNFFRLWNCIKGKEWFGHFLNHEGVGLWEPADSSIGLKEFSEIHTWLINCSALADAVIEFKKGEE